MTVLDDGQGAGGGRRTSRSRGAGNRHRHPPTIADTTPRNWLSPWRRTVSTSIDAPVMAAGVARNGELATDGRGAA